MFDSWFEQSDVINGIWMFDRRYDEYRFRITKERRLVISYRKWISVVIGKWTERRRKVKNNG